MTPVPYPLELIALLFLGVLFAGVAVCGLTRLFRRRDHDG